MKYEAPGFEKAAFTCPFCDVYANFFWESLLQKVLISPGGVGYQGSGLFSAECGHCKDRNIWLNHEGLVYMIWPLGVENASLPHADMPDDVKADYMEARNICKLSPRGAAALLRLSIQKLCKHLGEPGKNINTDIGSLVKKGLPVQIQQALDVVRVTGNNAVHPGEMSVEDRPDVVSALFSLINLIVDNRIAEPKRIEAMYKSLPANAIQGIEDRDS